MNDWWVNTAFEMGGAALLVAWVFWVVFSIVLHELSHGWTAIRLGDRTPIETGHMTWNPVVHMGWPSLIVFGIFGIAWGFMPIDPARIRGRHGDALVSVAGPAMNLLLAAVAIVLGVLWQVFAAPRVGDNAAQNIYLFFRIGAYLNLALLILNMLPVPPLDGARIIASFSPGARRFFATEGGAVFGLVLFFALFFLGAPLILEGSMIAMTTAWDALLGVFAGGGRP